MYTKKIYLRKDHQKRSIIEIDLLKIFLQGICINSKREEVEVKNEWECKLNMVVGINIYTEEDHKILTKSCQQSK